MGDVDGLIIHSHGHDQRFVSYLIKRSGRPKVPGIKVFSAPSPWMADLDVSFHLSLWAHWLYARRGGYPLRSLTLPYRVEGSGCFKDIGAREIFSEDMELRQLQSSLVKQGGPTKARGISGWCAHSTNCGQRATRCTFCSLGHLQLSLNQLPVLFVVPAPRLSLKFSATNTREAASTL